MGRWPKIQLVVLSLAASGCAVEDSASGETDTDAAASTGASSTHAGTGQPASSEPGGATTGAPGATSDDPNATSGPSSETSTGGTDPLRDPRAEGDEAVEVLSASIETPGRFTLPLTIHAPVNGGPYPVVIFLSGFLLDPSDYTSYGAHLGSWGYVVVMPELPGGTQAGDRDAVVELLDWLEGPGTLDGALLGGRADPERVMLAGHSRGGKLALLTASADTRVDAVFGVDPVDSAGGPGAVPSPDNPSVAPELMPFVLAPVTLVGETTNATGIMPCAPADENFEQYYAAAMAPIAAVDFLTASHMSFLDDPNCGITCAACPSGTDEPSVTRRTTQGYMVAFAQWQLSGESGYREYLAGAFTQSDVDAGLVAIETKNGY